MLAEIDVSTENDPTTHFGVGGTDDASAANERRSGPAMEIGSSEELLQRLHRGDCELFYELTEPFLNSAYAFIRSMLHNASTADDVFQETFLAALQKVHQLRDIRCLRSWVMQIAVNEVRMMWRASQRHPPVSIDELEDSEEHSPIAPALIDHHETPFQAAARFEVNGILEQALGELSPRCRAVFWLRDVEQLSGAETAAILGLTTNCVKSRLLRARCKLRAYLSPILDTR